MGYPVSYSGAIEVQPPLSDAHAKLVEVCVDLEGSEDLRPTLEAIKSSEEPDLPYHSGQTYITEDSSRSKHARESNVTDSDFGSSIW